MASGPLRFLFCRTYSSMRGCCLVFHQTYLLTTRTVICSVLYSRKWPNPGFEDNGIRSYEWYACGTRHKMIVLTNWSETVFPVLSLTILEHRDIEALAPAVDLPQRRLRKGILYTSETSRCHDTHAQCSRQRPSVSFFVSEAHTDNASHTHTVQRRTR